MADVGDILAPRIIFETVQSKALDVKALEAPKGGSVALDDALKTHMRHVQTPYIAAALLAQGWSPASSVPWTFQPCLGRCSMAQPGSSPPHPAESPCHRMRQSWRRGSGTTTLCRNMDMEVSSEQSVVHCILVLQAQGWM